MWTQVWVHMCGFDSGRLDKGKVKVYGEVAGWAFG